MSWQSISRCCREAVADGVFPGCVVLVSDRFQVRFHEAFGNTSLSRVGGKATTSTIYDTASLTKPLVTTTLYATAVPDAKLQLDAPVSRFLPSAPEDWDFTIRDLLCHQSGLPAWQAFYEHPGAKNTQEQLFSLVAKIRPKHPADRRAVYSDLGFILLGEILQEACGQRLDVLFQERIAAPLGLTHSFFPGGSAPGDLDQIAPTEACPRRGLVHGAVHDDNAAHFGGIFGHAGLFSTAADVLRIANQWLCAFHNEDSLLTPQTVRDFWQPPSLRGSTWSLGWDSPSAEKSLVGTRWPKEGRGHWAFTGCSVWTIPSRSHATILLSNRLHPTRSNKKIAEFRPKFHDLVMQAIDFERA